MNSERSEGCDLREKGMDAASWVPALLRAFKNKENVIHSSSCPQQSQLFPKFCITCFKLECKFGHKEGDYPHKDHKVLPNDSCQSLLLEEKSQKPLPYPHSYRTKERKGIPRRAPFF
ncbi:uncharacterized protein G2W53_019957 [Senna tora]|uniref:Uncharacterized protein n=1 Tax=Senna tora TaxID=362788 RepID=A0A834TUJ9_9FABA|nr:uncharacterized protein G2W53_019957 [Senna tora]